MDVIFGRSSGKLAIARRMSNDLKPNCGKTHVAASHTSVANADANKCIKESFTYIQPSTLIGPEYSRESSLILEAAEVTVSEFKAWN